MQVFELFIDVLKTHISMLFEDGELRLSSLLITLYTSEWVNDVVSLILHRKFIRQVLQIQARPDMMSHQMFRAFSSPSTGSLLFLYKSFIQLLIGMSQHTC